MTPPTPQEQLENIEFRLESYTADFEARMQTLERENTFLRESLYAATRLLNLLCEKVNKK